MERLKIDGQCFYNMVLNASNLLEKQKEYVNSLNVFPVPDGDTGTNMSMTFRSAVSEIEGMDNEFVGEISKKLAKGALMGARGNSGVILSQIFRGMAKALESKEYINSEEFANSLLEGSKFAYKAVMRPTEGTILTIIRAASESAIKCESKDITTLLQEVCEYSGLILNKTPEMLPVLKKAKVVDAGGMGLLIILQGMYDVLKNNVTLEFKKIQPSEIKSEVQNIEYEDIKFGYCTEFFIYAKNVDVDDFKDKIEKMGDSMVVVNDEDIIKVHIHTNDPGWILSQAIKLGELSKIKIDNMREQHRHIIDMTNGTSLDESIKKSPNENADLKKYAFISVALGKGIKSIFEDLGVDFVIEGGQTMNPSTEDILKCINEINAENIFILPNNKNIVMAANQAAELSNKNVRIINAKTIPEGITAVTAFNPDLEPEENIDAMEKSIEDTITGSVTYAVRDTEMDGKVIKKGDVLGIADGKIQEVGSDIFEICEKIISNMINDESELLTVFYGKDCDKEKVESFASKLEDKYKNIDVQFYNGEQKLYYFIISVE